MKESLRELEDRFDRIEESLKRMVAADPDEFDEEEHERLLDEHGELAIRIKKLWHEGAARNQKLDSPPS